MQFRRAFLLFQLFQILIFSSCYRMRASKGGGQIKNFTEREIEARDIAVPVGYKIEAVARGLTFPSAVAFDDSANLFVTEAGYSYGEVWGEPRLLQVMSDGRTKVVATGSRNGPWTGITYYQNAFYVAEGGQAEGGRILKIGKDGTITPLVSGLPSLGDHHTNGPVVKDGYIYFGQGTATNSGVVGTDNAEYGWLLRHKEFHDVPCADITLNGQNYAAKNVSGDSTKDVQTGAFVPFGTATTAGQVIKGALPCSGAVLRIPVAGGAVELVAWGLRNPFGMAIAPGNRLFVTDNAFDSRGSRPVWGSGDVLWEIKNSAWYGWPDYSAGKPIWNDEEFKEPTSKSVKRVLQRDPSTPPKPTAVFGVHASANGMDFSKSDAFGYKGEAFVAEFGDMAPKVGKVLSPVGYKVVRVNVETGVIRDFAVNRGKRNGPATWLGKGGLERPLSVRFNPAGDALYIADFGVMEMSEKSPQPKLNTGVIWKISKQ